MLRYIDDHREAYGVEPICKVLPIAPSTYYEQKARDADPSRLPQRVIRDGKLREQIEPRCMAFPKRASTGGRSQPVKQSSVM